MELAFFGQRAKRKAVGVSLAIVILISTLLPFVSSRTILKPSDWDWAVVHSQNVSFYTLKNVSRVLDVLVPPPVLPTSINVSAGRASINFNIGTNHGLSNYTSGSFDPAWEGQELGDIAADRVRNLLFLLAQAQENLTSIIMFNMTSNSSYVLMQSSSIHIDKLEFREDYLYWNERSIRTNNIKSDSDISRSDQGIWRLNTNNEISSWKAALYFPSNELTDFTIDPASRHLFWVGKDYNRTQIYAFDGLTNQPVITTRLFQPHALTTDCSYLYWADHPSHRDFTVQRSHLHNLKDQSGGERVYTGRDHSIISIAVLSNSTTVWSERNYVTMWVQTGDVPRTHDISDENGVVQPRGIISTYCNQPPNSSQISGTTFLAENGNTSLPAQSPSTNNSQQVNHHMAQPSPGKPSNQPQIPTQTKTVKPTHVSVAVPEKTDYLLDNAQADQANQTNRSQPLPKNPPKPDLAQRQYVPPPSTKLAHPEQSIPVNTELPATGIVLQHNSPFLEGRYNVGEEASISKTQLVNNLAIQWCSRDDAVICYNGGSCIQLDSVKICLCPPAFGGPNCQAEINRDVSPRPSSPNDIAYPIVCSVLSVSVVILSIVCTYLYLRVRELGKKPRIRRRLIVSRAPDSERTSVCEMVDIENCCNMNECETPCYERGSSSSSYASRAKLAPFRGLDSKKEDCQRLVDS